MTKLKFREIKYLSKDHTAKKKGRIGIWPKFLTIMLYGPPGITTLLCATPSHVWIGHLFFIYNLERALAEHICDLWADSGRAGLYSWVHPEPRSPGDLVLILMRPPVLSTCCSCWPPKRRHFNIIIISLWKIWETHKYTDVKHHMPE